MTSQRENALALSARCTSELLSGLIRTVAERIPAEGEIPAAHVARQTAIEKQSKQAQQELASSYRRQRTSLETEFRQTLERTRQQLDEDRDAARRQHEIAHHDAMQRFEDADQTARRSHQDARWEAMTIFEAKKDSPSREVEQVQSQVDARCQQLEAFQQSVTETLRKRWQWRPYPDPDPAEIAASEDPLQSLDMLVQQAQEQYQLLLSQTASRLFEGASPFWLCVLVWLVCAALSLLGFGVHNWYWIATSTGATAVLAVGVGFWLFQIGRGQTEEVYLELRSLVLAAERLRPQVVDAAMKAAKERYLAIVRQRDEDLQRADSAYTARAEEITMRRDADLSRVEKAYQEAIASVAERSERELAEVNQKYTDLLHRVDENFQKETERLMTVGQRAQWDAEQLCQRRWQEMAQHWWSGLGKFQRELDDINSQCDRLFPDWIGADWDHWSAISEILPQTRLGYYRIELGRIEGGIPQDKRLRPRQTEYILPAFLPFPEKSLLLLKASGAGRAAAVAMLQAIMLRMLTSLPPGKVRFTILDPVGLGENFSAFMHLADYNEQLVASRIWTDAGHIPHRLADLTDHMENVLQVYLRNEFQSIQEYNAFAGEMAEAYRVLVIANFPANFTEEAVRRLISIVSSGARCGVFTLMSLDTGIEPPQNFSLAELEHHALSFTWKDGRFVGKHPEYGELPLTAEQPPPSEKFTEIVRAVGRKVPEAGRIEVPFSHVAPDDGQFWTCDSRGGIDVPLGRAGAMKLQNLRLGKGTSQHVLISGKTGSGKSTLLHVLVTNIAMRYGPDQVEFYLIDFKKGVEFKAYATHGLPHARVIAIESEREFGLSVLERLDAELRLRGDLFRKIGVQDLHGYREAQPQARLPRILLVIDEFQELFVEEDRIAQNAALLLDRLVRQGRAFGIHVLLGSQTLGGAYSLARSTLGQMAVRIALQCSEADAHLILSEENSGARLLSRPGEAIYNDANGLYEGNHPFQIAWLDDHQREELLAEIRSQANRRGAVTEPPTVFEGNVAADIGENTLLAEALATPSSNQARRVLRAWLGSAVAIKEATAAAFARQSGANLLVVGQQEEAALGMLASATVSLAAQMAPASRSSDAPPLAQFLVLDGTRPDAPEAGYWNQLAGSLPHSTDVVGPAKTAEALGQISAELERREQAGLDTEPPLFLVVYNLSRFRDLRRADDDFGFSSFEEQKPANPGKQFSRILRDGPALGIHTLLWCDTLNNVSRWLDRQALRDVEMRVALQMNATDSSSLIDSPAAGKLGMHRAILYHEGQGWQEKFRPYGPPAAPWLAQVRQQLDRAPGSPERLPDEAPQSAPRMIDSDGDGQLSKDESTVTRPD